jgi:site-specific DNA-cytosine methylase
MEKMTAAHLFSGINASEFAAQKHNLPIEFLWTSEINPKAIAVQQKNFSDLPCYGSISDVIDRPGLPKVDLAIAGSSCQSFSVNGNGKGLDGSSGIVKEFWRYLKVHQPRFFIWENVASVTKPSNRETFEQIIAAFAGSLEFEEEPNIRLIQDDKGLNPTDGAVKYSCPKKGDRGWAIASTAVGYNLAWIVLNAKDTSPQNRERVYMIGCKDIPSAKILDALLYQYIAATCYNPAPKREYEGSLKLEDYLAYKPVMDFATYIKHPEKPEYLSAKALEKIWEKNKAKADSLSHTLSYMAYKMSQTGNLVSVAGKDWAIAAGIDDDFMCCFEEATRRLLSPSNWKVNGQRLTTPCLTVGDASMEAEQGKASKGHSGSKKLAIFYVEDGHIKARRITIEETETLQGFTPGWTAVEGFSDGLRRRLIGNSMATSSVAIALKAVCSLHGANNGLPNTTSR